MSGGIRVSPKHGLNPTMGVCWLCGEDNGEIGLLGRLPNDEEAPRRALLSKHPCKRCKDVMEQGVFLIEAREARSFAGEQEPVRTGRLWAVKDEAIRRMFNAEAAEAAIKSRVVFIEPEAAEKLGLPMETQ